MSIIDSYEDYKANISHLYNNRRAARTNMAAQLLVVAFVIVAVQLLYTLSVDSLSFFADPIFVVSELVFLLALLYFSYWLSRRARDIQINSDDVTAKESFLARGAMAEHRARQKAKGNSVSKKRRKHRNRH